MTVLSFRRRLDALEAHRSQGAPTLGLSPTTRLLNVLIAHHLGGVGPDESLADGTARGLGYEKGPDLRKALGAAAGTLGREDLNARWRDTVDRLLARRGVSPECGEPTAMAALAALYRELPDHLRAHPFMVECEGLFEAA